MPRRKTTIQYGKARTSPSKRGDRAEPGTGWKMPMNKPKGQREITTFIDEARADGECSLDALRQFQEAECKHERQLREIATGPTKKFLQCPDCGQIKTVAVKLK